MNFVWSDNIGKIWFKALISFIVVVTMGTWSAMNFTSEPKTFLDFGWNHIVLILGSLGIVAIGAINVPQKIGKNEETKTTDSANGAAVK